MSTALRTTDPAVLERKAVTDYILAVYNDKDFDRRKKHLVAWATVALFIKMGAQVGGAPFSHAARQYGIHFSEPAWWGFINDLRQPLGGDPRVAEFLKLLLRDEGLMRDTLAASHDLAQVARIAAGRGIHFSREELERYLAPFEGLSAFLRELLRAGNISEQQWQEITGFPSSDYAVYGSPEVDREMFAAVRMAANVLKIIPGMGQLAMPVGVVTGPWAAIVMNQIEGGSLTGRDLARMFEAAFMSMLEGMVRSLEVLAQFANPFGW